MLTHITLKSDQQVRKCASAQKVRNSKTDHLGGAPVSLFRIFTGAHRAGRALRTQEGATTGCAGDQPPYIYTYMAAHCHMYILAGVVK